MQRDSEETSHVRSLPLFSKGRGFRGRYGECKLGRAVEEPIKAFLGPVEVGFLPRAEPRCFPREPTVESTEACGPLVVLVA